MPPLARAIRRATSPPRDGYAFRARDLVGASSYSPLPLAASPVWVEAGDAMPRGLRLRARFRFRRSCPVRCRRCWRKRSRGRALRRAGGDIAAGSAVVEAGRRVLPRDLLIARAAGLERLKVRRPRLRIVNIPGGSGDGGSDRGERASRRRRRHLRHGRRARCRIDCGGAR